MHALINEKQLSRLVENLKVQQVDESDFQTKYDSMTEDAKKIFDEIYYNKQLNEASGWNTFFDVVGILDPTGVVDIANGISYLSQGDTFFGMLSLISAIPYAGDAFAKPVMLAGKGSKVIKEVETAMKFAKAGKTAEAMKNIQNISKINGPMARLMGSVRKWGPKLRQLVDNIPLGKLGQGLKNTVKDWIKLFEGVGAGAAKASQIAGKYGMKQLGKEEAINVLKQIKTAVETDTRLLRDFGGTAAKGLEGLSKYKMSGVPRLFGNKATRSLMRRTKFWTGFLDYLGLGNFVGPDELMDKMGSEFNRKMNEYAQTPDAQSNWNSEFGNADVETPSSTEDSSSGEQSSSSGEDMSKDLFSKIILGPLMSGLA